MKQLIVMTDVTKNYGTHTVLSHVSFTMEEKQIVTIHGLSGSGKSTLLNIIGLLDSHSSGGYIFDGIKIDPEKMHLYNQIRAEKIGFVFQSYCLIDSVSVEENIMMPFLYSSETLTKEISERMYHLCSALGIYDLRNKKAGLLSGGEKQRVAICRAMVKKPKIIIADEPTGNLDEVNTQFVVEALQKSNSEGTSILVVTHDERLSFDNETVYSLENGILCR